MLTKCCIQTYRWKVEWKEKVQPYKENLNRVCGRDSSQTDPGKGLKLSQKHLTRCRRNFDCKTFSCIAIVQHTIHFKQVSLGLTNLQSIRWLEGQQTGQRFILNVTSLLYVLNLNKLI